VTYLKNPLHQLLDLVPEEVRQRISIDISEPYSETGVWFADIRAGDYFLVVQYAEAFGFGVTAEGDFGDRPDELFEHDQLERAAARVTELLAAKAYPISTATLPDLRGEQTQASVASVMQVKQPSYAKMERASLATLKISTLEKVVGAMNGKLHLVVEMNGRFFRLSDKVNLSKAAEGLDPAVGMSMPPLRLAVLGHSKRQAIPKEHFRLISSQAARRETASDRRARAKTTKSLKKAIHSV
jgi:hypothetical protein